MKNWLLGRVLMDEAGTEGGGGGGSAAGEGNVEAGTPSGGEGEEKPNALADDLNKPGEGEGSGEAGAGNGEGEGKGASEPSEKPKEPAEEGSKPITDEESKAYNDALKLDEKIFGKTDFDPYYRKEMPAFFKRHGIDPEKANKMANEFAAMQKNAGEKHLAEMKKAHEERMAGLQKMNEAYYRDYDKPARETIGKAIQHFVKKDSSLWHTLTKTEVGVDKEMLELLHFVGERLPKGSTKGASDGAGAGGGKSLADSFMGV